MKKYSARDGILPVLTIEADWRDYEIMKTLVSAEANGINTRASYAPNDGEDYS